MLLPTAAAARSDVASTAVLSLDGDLACAVRKVKTTGPRGRVVSRTVRTRTSSQAGNRTTRTRPASRQSVPPATGPSLVCQDVEISTVRSSGVVIQTVRNCS